MNIVFSFVIAFSVLLYGLNLSAIRYEIVYESTRLYAKKPMTVLKKSIEVIKAINESIGR